MGPFWSQNDPHQDAVIQTTNVAIRNNGPQGSTSRRAHWFAIAGPI